MVKNLLSILLIAAPITTILAQGPQQLVSSKTFVPYGRSAEHTSYSYSKKSRVAAPIFQGLHNFAFSGVSSDEGSIVNARMKHNADTIKSHISGSDSAFQYNTYDNNHRLIKSVEHTNFDARILETNITYHANGNIKEHNSLYRDTSASNMYESRRIDKYHDDGRIESYFNSYPDYGDTVKFHKMYTYDASKRKIAEYQYIEPIANFPQTSSYGLDSLVYSYANGVSNNPSEVVRYGGSYSSNGFSGYSYRSTRYFTYNAQGKTIVDSLVDDDLDADVYRHVYYGDSLVVSYFNYDYGNPVREGDKDIYVYNTAGSLTALYYYSYGIAAPNYSYHYTYNAQNFLTNASYYSLNNNVFALRDTITYKYNANNNIVNVFNADSSLYEEYVYQDAQGEEDPTSVEELPNFAAKVYPNPVQGVLNLAIELADYDVVLYNASGVLLGHYNNVKSLDFTYRPTGSYIINVIDNKTGAAVAKTIIKN